MDQGEPSSRIVIKHRNDFDAHLVVVGQVRRHEERDAVVGSYLDGRAQRYIGATGRELGKGGFHPGLDGLVYLYLGRQRHGRLAGIGVGSAEEHHLCSGEDLIVSRIRRLLAAVRHLRFLVGRCVGGALPSLRLDHQTVDSTAGSSRPPARRAQTGRQSGKRVLPLCRRQFPGLSIAGRVHFAAAGSGDRIGRRAGKRLLLSPLDDRHCAATGVDQYGRVIYRGSHHR